MAILSAAALKKRMGELLEIKPKEVDDILWAFQEVATETIKSGDTLTLPGVVKLSCQVRPARKARNPRTGDPVQVPAKVVVKAALVKSLKDSAPALKSKTGRALLASAEEKQAERDKRKRKKERAEEKSSSKKSSKKKVKKSSKSSKENSGKKKKKKASRY